MASNWSRVLNSTTANYIRDREDNTLRNRKLSAMLKKRGRITYNWSGTIMDWKVKYKRIRPQPFADGDTQEFSRKERYRTAQLGWRGYAQGDSITKGEFLQNRGKEAIIKIFSTMAENLMDDFEDFFGEEFYLNGYATGNQKRLHGIESFMAATINSGNIGAQPTATYANLPCTPGALGGTWDGGTAYNGFLSNGWPNGRGDAHFDFWSPLVVDYGDPALPGGTTNPNWAWNCEEAISFALIKSQKSMSKKGRTDLILLDDEMYRIYKAKQRAKQRIEVTNNSSELVSLGFSDIFNQDGCDITWEYGIPASVGYGWNFENLELRSQQGQLFVPDGPQFDMSSRVWKLSVDFFGNLVFNPKFFFKLTNLTNPSNPIGS